MIGKAASSPIGKHLIGKASHFAHKMIGKAHHAWSAAKELPVVGGFLANAENNLQAAKDTKTAFKAASEMAGIGTAYSNNQLSGSQALKAVDVAVGAKPKRVYKKRARTNAAASAANST